MFHHTLQDSLGRQYRFSTGLIPDTGRGPWWDSVIPCRTYGRQVLQNITEAPGDPFNSQLQTLWLYVNPRPWARPSSMEQLINDLADSIGRGHLKAWRVDSPNWHNGSSVAATHVSESDDPQVQNGDDEPGQQARQQSTANSTTSTSNTNRNVAAATLPMLAAAALAKPTAMDPVDARKLRYQARKDLVAANADNPDLQQASERLAFNNDNILRAEAAEYVYRVDEYNRGHIDALPNPPVGLELIDPGEIAGLEDATFMSDESGFGAALFKSEINNETMLAYRGTNNGVTGGRDWPTNMNQFLGRETEQYNQAMELARVSQRDIGNDLSLVGHSLGGGLASAGVAVTGLRGYTFNAAGLHPNTAAEQKGLANEETAELIETQTVEGEFLALFQNYGGKALGGLMGGAAGSLVSGGVGTALGSSFGMLLAKDFPSALGKNHMLPSVSGGSPIKRHEMAQVVAGIESQKGNDIKALSEAGMI
ncbi:MAG: DUF2974 domain-containing protein [Halomonadaceae bacterium]|nr:MAG: DUF2974 domain-containing protein [Halomonadaceae bacterium]